MIFTRIKSYDQNGKFTNCEHLYLGKSHTNAILKFRREYPEHDQCIVIAETYDSNDPKNKEHFNIMKKCGCIH